MKLSEEYNVFTMNDFFTGLIKIAVARFWNAKLSSSKFLYKKLEPLSQANL